MSQSNRGARKHQQQRVAAHASDSDSYVYFNLLTSPELLDHVEQSLPEHRERLFPPTETLSMFIAQALDADRSCQKAVDTAAIKRVAGSMKVCSTATGGYCRARQRLPLSMVKHLVHKSAQLMDQTMPQQWLWHQRRVRLIDGTTVVLPDTASNQAAYGQPSTQKRGIGFPQCQLVSMICLSTGAVLDTATGPCEGKGNSEQSLLRQLLDSLQPDDVLLGDAYYPSYFLLCDLNARQVDGVFEQHGGRRRTSDFRTGKRLGKRDHLIRLYKPKKKPDWMSQQAFDQAPESVLVRELHAGGKLLVTTLMCPKQASKAQLKELYRKRWHVELDLRHIKDTLGLEMLSCKSAPMAEKELWVYLLAYNLVRLLMAQSALLSDILPRQLSFKHTVQLWTAWCQIMGSRDVAHAQQAMLFELIGQCRVGDRPGRIEPRAIKRRPKPFPVLSQPRQIAREQLIKHGHPKKQK